MSQATHAGPSAPPPPAAAVPRVLDLGCGTKKREGAIGLDCLPLPGVDVVHDVERVPWPLADASFDEVHCLHVLEHVDDICAVMDELHRVTRPGGRVHVVVPYFARYSAFKDPTHRRFCTYESFDYFVEGTGERDRRYSRHAFRYVSRRLRFSSGLRGRLGGWLARRHPKTYERHWARMLPARTLELVLTPAS